MKRRPKSTKSGAVLGVSAHYHDAAAALVVGGEIIAAASEERFTRKKGDASMPINAIEYVLDAGDVSPEELELCVFYESPPAKLERLVTTQTTGNRAPGLFVRSLTTWVPQKLWVERQLRQALATDVKVITGDHHLSHAASAFIPSPFRDSAVLTVDGVGEWTTTAISRGEDGCVEFLEQIEYPNSLGLLYSAFTLYCGFKINSGEYKLMGLAPYGTPRYRDVIESELVCVNDDGSFALNPEYFTYVGSLETYGEKFEELLGGPGRAAEQALEQRHVDIAASIQSVTNDIMVKLARRAVETTGSRNLCLAGGVALNVVSVGAIERDGAAENVWVQPAAGDAGGALGAALWASHQILEIPRRIEQGDAMKGSLLGPEPGKDEEIRSLLDDYQLTHRWLGDHELAELVAEMVGAGMVVAVAKGRMEYGPRALGARSILADARDPQMQTRLNLKTKFREGFRPFAPIVLEEKAENYFDTRGRTSPYMLKTYTINEDLRRGDDGEEPELHDVYSRVRRIRSTLPAVTHVDMSARIQTVDRERNPFLHSVLDAFEKSTGCAVMVNTSFNVRGEPIVCSALDAVECFLRTDVDALVIGNHVVLRADQQPEALRPRVATTYEAD